MKNKALTIAMLTAASLGFGAPAAHARVDVNVGPPPYHRRVYFDRRPEFLYTPRLGFSVTFGGPYDMIMYGNRYYVYDNGGWYWSSAYDGPWRYIEHRRLPRSLRRYRHEEIRRYRDDEYRRRYRRDWRDRRDWDDRRGPDRDWRDRDDHRGPDRGPDRWR